MTGTLAASTQVSVLAGATLLAVGAVVLLATRRFGVALALYAIYLGTLDGYLKLATGSEAVAVVRTVLLAVIVAASLLALLTDRRPAMVPRGTVLVGAFVVVTLVQIANPGNPNLIKPIGSLRQEIEFVPLFFLAYATIRREADLQNLLLLLVAVAVANGIANVVQYNLSPEQFAGWGPGYRDRIFGTTGVSGRIFDDGSATGRARPFGLGSDAGSGGIVGMLAAGATAALILRPRPSWLGSASVVRGCAVAAVPFVVVAVVLSLTRAVVVATVLALLVYALVSVRRQLLPLVVVGAITFLAGGVILQSATGGSSGGNGLDRYTSIKPGELVSTTRDQRGSAFAILPTYIGRYPFGAGLGGVGPSAGFRGQVRPEEQLNGEIQLNVTVLDTGVPGLVLLAAIIAFVLRRIRRLTKVADVVTQAQLAAIAGAFVGILALCVSGSPLTTVPAAPFFWAAAGILCYWMRTGRDPVARTSSYSDAWASRTRSHVSAATASRAADPIA